MSHNATAAHFESPYGYTPTRWVCIFMIVLFGITTALHLGQALFKKPRLYWLLPTAVFCGIVELIGWSGRLWSSYNVLNSDAFTMQICCTIFAPVFLTAAQYTTLGRAIYGPTGQYSRLKPKAYLAIFLTADIVALVVQALGGATASIAANNGRDATPGTHIMLAGIWLQLVGVCIYLFLLTEITIRFHMHRPVRTLGPSASTAVPLSHDSTPTSSFTHPEKEGQSQFIDRAKVGKLLIGLMLGTLFVFIRSIYRTVELSGGWRGKVITTQTYFNVLDGGAIVVAMFLLNLFHPTWLLPHIRP